jgi:hypothetical protein
MQPLPYRGSIFPVIRGVGNDPEKEREKHFPSKTNANHSFYKMFFILYLNDLIVGHTNVYLKTDLKYFTIKALILKYDAVKLFLITKH